MYVNDSALLKINQTLLHDKLKGLKSPYLPHLQMNAAENEEEMKTKFIYGIQYAFLTVESPQKKKRKT